MFHTSDKPDEEVEVGEGNDVTKECRVLHKVIFTA